MCMISILEILKVFGRGLQKQFSAITFVHVYEKVGGSSPVCTSGRIQKLLYFARYGTICKM